MKKIIQFIFLILIGTSTWSQTNSDSIFVVISGTVTNQLNSQPIPQHEVRFTKLGVDPVQSTFTDSLGKFSFNYISNGPDSVSVFTIGNCFGEIISYENTFIVDSFNTITNFEICHITDTIACNALFTYNILNDRTIQFLDLSTTSDSVSWYWDFGDGTTSTLQNPIHTFNNEFSSFQVCLTIEDIQCNDIYCETINFSTTTFYYGFARFNDAAFENCTVRLIPQNDQDIWYTATTNSNGLFNFNNIPDSDYIIEVIPEIPFDYYTPQILPTYYPNALFWSNAQFAIPEQANIINYVTNATINYGTQTITGQFNDPDENLTQKPTILLLDYNNNPVTFSTTQSNNSFELNDLDEGIYQVYPQLSGFITTPINIEITDNEESLHVVFDVTNTEIIPAVTNINELQSNIKVYPIPANKIITISSKSKIDGFEIYNVQGQLVQRIHKINSNSFTINTEHWELGLYTIKIVGKVATIYKKIVIKR
jgi:PKD repeat protein